MKTQACFFVLSALVLTGLSCRKSNQQTGTGESSPTLVEHQLDIVRPGAPETADEVFILSQHLDDKNQPDSYSMWVDSVVCREKHCDVVKVRIHWDALGRYQRYGVAQGSILTKLDHKPFTRHDLEKLHTILLNKNSPLGEVEKEAMTGEKQKKSENSALDGVSGATILALKNDVILGAGYTCYDLWHIANGAVVGHIQERTGKDSSVEVLKNYLNSEDILESKFAIESLQKRNIGNAAISKEIMVRALHGDKALVLPAMTYFKETSPSKMDYRKSLLEFFNKASSRQRVLFLKNLLSESPAAAPEFYQALCKDLPSLETFYETQLFFRLCEKQKTPPPVVIPHALKLLSHKNFFVQRRAFEYLDSKPCQPDVQAVLDEYYQKNKNRL
jgi:hypothetical protein